MAVNQSEILRKAYIIASRGSQWARDIVLNDIEEAILEEALRAAGVPNLPSGGAPLASLDGSRQMLLEATVHNLSLNAAPVSPLKQVLVKQSNGEYERVTVSSNANGQINIIEVTERKRILGDESIKHILDAYFFPIIHWTGYTQPYGTIPSLKTHADKISYGDLICAEKEIKEYVQQVRKEIPDRIKKAMDVYWKITDREIIEKNPCQQVNTGNGHGYTDRIGYERGTVGAPPMTNPDGSALKDGWKRVAFNREWDNTYSVEYRKWFDYCKIFYERAQSSEVRPWHWEAREQIDKLKAELAAEKEKRLELEKKRDALRAKLLEELI